MQLSLDGQRKKSQLGADPPPFGREFGPCRLGLARGVAAVAVVLSAPRAAGAGHPQAARVCEDLQTSRRPWAIFPRRR
jgi:hypothetical protein